MEKALVTISEAKELGDIFVNSGLFKDINDRDKAIVKIVTGRELGLQPMESMIGINIIQGNITLSANAMSSAVKSHPRYDYRVVKLTEKECVIDFYQDKEKIGTSEFTIEEANKIGLTSKQVWRQYPKNMLFARAISNGIRWHCPDVFGHSKVYHPEELGAEVDEDGNIKKYADGHTSETIEPVDAEYTMTYNDSPEEPEPEDNRKADAEIEKTIKVEEVEPKKETKWELDFPKNRIRKDTKPEVGLAKIMSWGMQSGNLPAIKSIIVEMFPELEDKNTDEYSVEQTIAIVKKICGKELKVVD